MAYGGSVLGVVYRDGVMLGADNRITIHSVKTIEDATRIHKLPYSPVLVGFTGDFRDAQAVMKLLEEKELKSKLQCQPPKTAAEMAAWLTRYVYEKRTKLQPVFASVVVAGVDQQGKPHLSCRTSQGAEFSDNVVATGMGSIAALPLMREEASVDMDEEAAKQLLLRCLATLHVVELTAHDKVTLAKVTTSGAVQYEGPLTAHLPMNNTVWASMNEKY